MVCHFVLNILAASDVAKQTCLCSPCSASCNRGTDLTAESIALF